MTINVQEALQRTIESSGQAAVRVAVVLVFGAPAIALNTYAFTRFTCASPLLVLTSLRTGAQP